MAEYTSTQLNSMGLGQANDMGDGGIVNYQGKQYKVSNTGRGTRNLEEVSGGGGGGGGSTSGGSLGDLESSIKRAQEMYSASIQPAVSTMQQQVPLVQQQFSQAKSGLEKQIDPLKQRYQNIIDELNRTSNVQQQAQTKVTSNEMGKRGLLPSSTLVQQEMQNAVTPIADKYATQIKDVGLSQEDSLNAISAQIAQLPLQEQQQIQAINQAIAQLQANTGQTAITTGTNLYETNLKNELAKQQEAAQAAYQKQVFDAQQAQQTIDNQLKQAQLANQTRQTAYDTSKPYSSAADNNIFNTPEFLQWRTDMEKLKTGGKTATVKSTTPAPVASYGKSTPPPVASYGKSTIQRPALNTFYK